MVSDSTPPLPSFADIDSEQSQELLQRGLIPISVFGLLLWTSPTLYFARPRFAGREN